MSQKHDGDVSALFGGSSNAFMNAFDAIGDELAISEDEAHLFAPLPSEQAAPAITTPQYASYNSPNVNASYNYFGTPSPRSPTTFSPPAMHSPAMAPPLKKVESTLGKKQVNAYDPPVATRANATAKRQRSNNAYEGHAQQPMSGPPPASSRQASVVYQPPQPQSTPYSIHSPTSPPAAQDSYKRPPSSASLRALSPPPLLTSSPLNPARPPSRTSAQPGPPSRSASRNSDASFHPSKNVGPPPRRPSMQSPPPSIANGVSNIQAFSPPTAAFSTSQITRGASPAQISAAQPSFTQSAQVALESPVPDLTFQPPSPMNVRTPNQIPSPSAVSPPIFTQPAFVPATPASQTTLELENAEFAQTNPPSTLPEQDDITHRSGSPPLKIKEEETEDANIPEVDQQAFGAKLQEAFDEEGWGFDEDLELPEVSPTEELATFGASLQTTDLAATEQSHTPAPLTAKEATVDEVHIKEEEAEAAWPLETDLEIDLPDQFQDDQIYAPEADQTIVERDLNSVEDVHTPVAPQSDFFRQDPDPDPEEKTAVISSSMSSAPYDANRYTPSSSPKPSMSPFAVQNNEGYGSIYSNSPFDISKADHEATQDPESQNQYASQDSPEYTSHRRSHNTSSSGSTTGTAGIGDSYPFSERSSPPAESPAVFAHIDSSNYFSPPKTVPSLPSTSSAQFSPQKQASASPYSAFSYGPPSIIAAPTTKLPGMSSQTSREPATTQSSLNGYHSSNQTSSTSAFHDPPNLPSSRPASRSSLKHQPSLTSFPLQPSLPMQPTRNDFQRIAPQNLSIGPPPVENVPIQRQYSPVPPQFPSEMRGAAERGIKRAHPIACFAFGGKLLTYFPPAATGSTLYGYSGSSSTSSLMVRSVALLATREETFQSFPGPLFGSASSKTKKKELLTWINNRVSELEKNDLLIGADTFGQTLRSNTVETINRNKEKILLYKLLKALVDNDGKLSGSAKLDETVKSILVPDMKPSQDSDVNFITPASFNATLRSSSPPLKTSELRASDLDTIQKHLLLGDRRAALRYALDKQLWVHAMLIATSLDKDAWRDAVSEFIKTDLSVGTNQYPSLKIAYGLFAGLGATTVENVFPSPNADQQKTPSTALSLPLSVHPISRAPSPSVPSFPDISPSLRTASPEQLDDWLNMLSMIVFNKPTAAVDSSALVSLGDTLLINGKTEAANICYLIALPPGSSGSGLGPRLALLNNDFRQSSGMSSVDNDALIMTESFEFGLSLAPSVKGQEPFIGLPQFQAWRLVLASRLADSGQVLKAQKYCESVTSTLKLATKSSPFYNWTLCHQLPALAERISALPAKSTEAGSWVGRKMQRPTLDSLWGTLEGRFTSFVAGETEQAAPTPSVQEKPKGVQPTAGPFANYSSISPAGSGPVSRAGSTTDLQEPLPNGSSPYPSYPASYSPYQPTSSSLKTGSPSAPSTPPRKANTKAAHHQHTRSQSLGFLAYGSDPYANAPSWISKQTAPVQPEEHASPESVADEQKRPDNEGGSSWWGASADERSPQQPVFFSSTEANLVGHKDGFVSPMSAAMPSSERTQSSMATSSRIDEEMEEDDLGFGNNTNKRRRELSEQPEGTPSTSPPERSASVPPPSSTMSATQGQSAAQQPPPALRSSSSFWGIGRLFKRDGTASPGPTRANLGEETSFVYDPELKRWVNKKAAGTAENTVQQVSAPPPPSRPHTASPHLNHSASPPIPASTPKLSPVIETVSQSLGPPPVSVRSSPDPSSNMPPPARRAASAAGKKARSKYIVVD